MFSTGSDQRSIATIESCFWIWTIAGWTIVVECSLLFDRFHRNCRYRYPDPRWQKGIEWLALRFWPKGHFDRSHRYPAIDIDATGLFIIDLALSERPLLSRVNLSQNSEDLDLIFRSHLPTAPCIGHCCVSSQGLYRSIVVMANPNPPKETLGGQHLFHISPFEQVVPVSN